MGYQPKVYRDKGGNRLTAASGSTVRVQSGATFDVKAGAHFKVEVVAGNATALALPVTGMSFLAAKGAYTLVRPPAAGLVKYIHCTVTSTTITVGAGGSFSSTAGTAKSKITSRAGNVGVTLISLSTTVWARVGSTHSFTIA
jgi:hypothetical protein